MTTIKLKPLEQQVVVVTGATSGIGLAVAREAARRGARVVLTARNEEDLKRIADEITAAGGRALAVSADVADRYGLERVRDAALKHFGAIDTWVNNAGIALYGRLRDVDLIEARRLFDVNFWGTVHGCRAAMSVLRESGGAIINVGSILSERVVPYQGLYAASKQAVKAYTSALRLEAEMDRLPVAVTLVRPSAVDTPSVDHARSHLAEPPRNIPPVYTPDLVARVVLHCAEHSRRDVIVGSGRRVLGALERIAPRVTDKMMVRTVRKLQKPNGRSVEDDSLFLAPLIEGQTRGIRPVPHVRERSLSTSVSLRPLASGVALAALVLAIGGALFTRR